MPNRRKKHQDVLPWVREALSHRRWFGDASPHWVGAETSSVAEQKHKRAVRFLKKHADDAENFYPELNWMHGLADRIASCDIGDPCLADGCPKCTRAMQRYLVQEWGTFIQRINKPQLIMATLIVGTDRNLSAEAIEPVQRRTTTRLRIAGVAYAFGGLDVSFNQTAYDDDPGEWCLHYHLVIPTNDVMRWKQHLLASAKQSMPYIRRPLLLKPFDGSPQGLAYLFKTDFKRRVSYIQKKVRNGKTRTCFNTSEQLLRVSERMQLHGFLSRHGLASRVFLLGARPTRTDEGISIVKIRRKSANSELAEKPQLARQKPT
jgi:hypothetical protein